MKKKYLILFAIVLFYGTKKGNDFFDPEEARFRYEKLINERFKSTLSQIVPERFFNLSTHVEIKIENKDEATSRKIKKQEKNKKPVAKKRPGFDFVEDNIATSENEEFSEEDYKINKKIELKSVGFTLFLDNSLSEDIRKIVSDTLERKMEKNFKKIASLEIKTLDLDKFHKEKERAELFHFFRSNLLHFVYLLALIIALVLILIFFRKSKNINNTSENRNINDEENETDGEEEETESKKEELKVTLKTLKRLTLSCYDKQTATLKSFVKVLGEEELNILAKSLEGSLFNDEVLRFSDKVFAPDEEFEDKITVEKVKLAIQNLKDYIALHNIAKSEPFGFLDKMDADSIFEALKDDEKQLALVLSVLNEKKSEELLDKLEVDKKAKILSLLSEEKDEKKEAEDLKMVESKLRKMFEEKEKEEFSYNKELQEKSLDLLLNQDKEVDLTIQKAKESHKVKLDEKYDLYTMTFEELVQKEEHQKALQEIIQNLENEETLALLSLVEDEQKKKDLLASLPKTRKNILSSLQNTYEVTESIQAEAKKNFMKKYRETTKNSPQTKKEEKES